MDFNDMIYLTTLLGIMFKGCLLFVFLYYFIISIFGWFKRKEQSAEDFKVENKFAIIISAHNEEQVIGGALRSLRSINYPEDMYDIFVIADNCNDNTAIVAKKNGAKVFERSDSLLRGKGYALEWMFSKLDKMDKKYDAICILDADNLVSKNFFMEMNKQLLLGHHVIQGYLDSKNPHDSWISGNYSIAYWISNRLFQLPRYYLGLNCALGGTGFVMSTSVLKKIGWGATCLTEDLEFSMKLVLNGMKVSWSHYAIVYDEKPLKMAQSWKQRRRWMQGHSDCAIRYLRELIKRAILKKDIVAFDSALYLIQPFIIVANGLGVVYALINLLFFKSSEEIFRFDNLFIAMIILFITYINIVFLIAEQKLTKKVALYFISFPFYSLTWVPIIIMGFLYRKERVWVHTIHTRALDIDDMEALKIEKTG